MEQKTSIKYIWKHNVAHHYVNQTDETTANNHILQIVDFMQRDNILDLDSNPQLIDILRQKLSEYIQPSGKYKTHLSS